MQKGAVFRETAPAFYSTDKRYELLLKHLFNLLKRAFFKAGDLCL